MRTAATPCSSCTRSWASGDGPTVGISGAIHGNENTGSQAILELYRAAASTCRSRGGFCCCRSPIRGPSRSITASPRSTSSISTASSPAIRSGNYTQQLAAAITREFLDKIDVHHRSALRHRSSDRGLRLHLERRSPVPRFRLEDPLSPDARKRRHGVCRHHEGRHPRQARTSRRCVVELGGGIVDQTPYVKRTARWRAQHAALKLGSIEGEVEAPPKQIVVNELVGDPADAGRLARDRFAPPNGETIKGGALLGRVVSPYTFETLGGDPDAVRQGVMIMQHLDAQRRRGRRLRLHGGQPRRRAEARLTPCRARSGR